jgi:hypothetical protein
MQKITMLVSAMVFLMVLATPADARRGGGFHGARGHVGVNRGANVYRHTNINRNVSVNRNVNVNRYVYRNGQRGYWRNGVWVAAPAAAVGYVASCTYERSQWQATGSAYWRNRYYQCANR